MTARTVTVPGDARDCYVEDFAHLFPGGVPATVGLPPSCDFSLQVEDRGGVISAVVIRITPRKVLPEGKFYFMQPADVIQALVNDSTPDPSGAVAWRLARTAGAAAAVALGRLNYVPLVYVAGPAGGPPVTFATHIRTTMSGTFQSTGGEEEWTCGTSWASPGNMPDTVSQACMEALYANASAQYFGTNQTSGITPDCVLRSVEYAVIRPDGKVGGGQVQRFFGAADSGGGARSVDFALSYAVTLDAGGARGGRYGRFYPPPMDVALSGGRADAQTAIQMVQIAKGWLGGINAALNAELPSSAVALVVASQLGGGGNRNVREIRVGRVPDHQSRRRRGLAEEYAITTWPPA